MPTLVMIYGTIGAIALLACMSPGPDFIVVAKYAFSEQRRHALFATLGISLGVLIHSTYCVLGLALIISQSLLLFGLIKIMGAAYLIYLGIKSLCSRIDLTPCTIEKEVQALPIHKAFIDGLLTNVLNPKCTVFMLSIFTMVVKPGTAWWAQASYGLEIVTITLLWFVLLSTMLTLTTVRRQIKRAQVWVNRTMGVILVGLGVMVLFEGR